MQSGPSYGAFAFGPIVNGKLTPALRGRPLLLGQFDKSVEVMVGHNLNETLLSTSPFLTNDTSTALTNHMHSAKPSIIDAAIFHPQNVLYPLIFNCSFGYVNE
jgi:hypothetical protein